MRDFVERYWLAIVLAATILTRLPFLWTGYGADGDDWLVAKSALRLWTTGVYHESRLPGYPLHEIVSAPFVGMGGAPLSNAATLLATLAAIVVWSRIADRIGRHTKLLVIAFAFAPVVWQHSAETIDYMWSLLFILASLLALLRQRVLFAGIALGIAAGFRPSNFAAIVPLLCLLYLQKQSPGRGLTFIFSALLMSVVAFIPLVVRYGVPGWLVATQQEMSDVLFPRFAMRCIAFFYRTVYFIGPLAAGIAGFAFWKRKDLILTSLRSRDPIVVTSLLGVFIFLLLFLWLPMERAYLLPALPFFLLLVDKVSSRRLFAAFTLFLVLSALVNFDVIDTHDRRAFKPNIHPGMVIEELAIREKLLPERMSTSPTKKSGDLK
jgi:MFS family permease